MPTIIITGSRGLVGSGLVSHFSKLGFQVRAFQRGPKNGNHLVTYYPFDLADVQDNGFEGADYIVHCAYRPVISRYDRELGVNIDIEGTSKIITLAIKYGIKIVFLSTLSAHSAAKSYYAKNKLLAERLFDTHKDLILKIGIVIGNGGGLFGRIISNLKKHKIIPLIGGGKQYTQTIALDDLCRIIEIGIKQNITGSFKISHPNSITTKELYHEIADSIGTRCLFISVPLGVVYQLVRFIECMGFKLSFTSENILGLKDLRVFDTTTDLERFGVTVKNYKVTLEKLKKHI